MIKKIVPISSIVLLTLLFIYCTTDESTIIGPFGNADKYISVENLTTDKEKIYSKGDTSVISLKVLDFNKTPAIGLIVNFSAQFGSITKSDTTDSSGVATAIFVSDENTGTNIITINTGIKKYTLSITVVKYQPTTIELSAESLVLLADGNDYTKITAIPRDEDGNIMTDITFQLNTSLGTLSSNPGDKTEVTSLTANSGSTGQEAIVYLRSDANGGTAEVTATSGIASSINVYFHLDVPAYIILTADPKVVMADGSSTSIITATVLDETGTEMEDMTVSFLTTSGTLNFPVRTTDENGIAEVELTSSTAEETATVTASAYISSSVDVKFTMDIPYQIVISASPTRVIADGSTVSIITAIPKDKDGNPMVGIDVSFSTGIGIGALNKFYDETDENGIAEVALTSTVEGTATVTASVSSTKATTNVTFYEYNPTSIEMEREESSILADGFSQIQIIARALDPSNEPISGAVIDFSTNYGTLDKTTGVVANQSGDATVTITSEGSSYDLDVRVKAVVQGTSLADSIAVKFRGIYIDTNIDSARMSDSGIYKAYVSARLFEDTNGENITSGAVFFSSPVGTMDELVQIDEQGNAASVFEAEVLPTNQNNIIITSELSSSSAVFSESEAFDIPGVEILINTIDDEVMGDGEGWVLLKSTLREISGKAITETRVDWKTTLGTIKRQSQTNTTGHTIDSLRIEYAVGADTDVTITANFGDHISMSEILKFIPPTTNNRLILGAEADTTGHGIIPCDLIDSLLVLGANEMGISAGFVNSGGKLVYPGQEINFSVSPNNLAGICPTDTTDVNSMANVMLLYPPQNEGEIVRVWSTAPDGTQGSIDIILLQKDPAEDDSGGGE